MKLLDHILSLVAPLQCLQCGTDGNVLCRWCLPEVIELVPSRCVHCKKASADAKTCHSCISNHGLPRHVWVYGIYDGFAKALLHKLKFKRCRSASETIAEILSDSLPYLPKNTIITHVPTAPRRIRQRGFDQSKLIAHHLAKLRNLPHKSLLERSSSIRQVGATRAQRLKQTRDIFSAKTINPDKTLQILLIDDIYTTGGTLSSATQTLKRHGYKNVNAVVFAQTI